MRRVLELLVLLCCCLCCHGNDEENINHLVLLEGLPPAFTLTNPPNIVLTTNYSGVVDFRESNEFKVLLNISAPTIDEAYAVHSEVLSSKGRLLIQVYEDAPARFALSFPWICICIVMAAAVVASIAIVYVLWWYCSKQYQAIENDKFSHGNVMYRSRNSMHLSSTNPGESVYLQDNEEGHGEDTLREVPEEEEGGAIEMRKMRRSVGRYDDEDLNAPTERVYVKQRYMSSAQKLHQERVKREGRRKRHPSLNDPPPYHTVMEYPHDSSDESDGETSKKKQLEPLLESTNSIDKQSEHSYQTMHRTPEVPAFRSFDLPLNTTARSDGELDRRNSGRNYRSPYGVPNFVRGRMTPVSNPDEQERQSRASNIIYSNHTSRDSVQTVIRRSNSRDSTPSHRTSRDSLQPREASSRLDSPAKTESSRSQSPYQVPVMADIHKDTSKSSDSSSGIVKMQTVAGPPLQPITPYEPGMQATGNSNPMDIPLTSFKSSEKRKKNIPSPLVVPGMSVDPSSGTEDEVFDDKGDDSDVYMYPVSSSPDPRGLRFSVVSDKSLSMYGSSEIFDANQEKGEFYQELDSDLEVEIPPLESDADILSDTSLPLPSPPPFAKEPPSPGKPVKYDESPPRRQRTISMPGDPWDDLRGGKLIAIAASPTATMDKHFVFPPTGNDGQEDPAYRDPAETMQHHPYLDGQPVTKYLPPPPPKMYHPPQRNSWAREGMDYSHRNGSPNRNEGEYVRVQRSVSMREQPGRRAEEGDYARLQRSESGRQGSLPRRGGGKRKGFLPKQLHLAIVCSFCILSLVNGVYSMLGSNKMQVHITVYAPASFLSKDIAVYFNQNKPGHLVYNANNVKAYDMSQPTIEKLNSSLCDSNTCVQGCDEDTGLCICRKGYKFNNKGECKDVNECHAGTFRCHKDAGCLNTEGSYRCMCTGQFYGDGKTCEECGAPCRGGTYEIQACDKNQDKTCRECTKECSTGFYMHKPCGVKEDTICRMCQRKCGDTHFEYKRCSRTQNRECRDRKDLQEPHTSPNMIIENKLDRSTDEQAEMPYTAKFNIWRNTFKKGSGFYVEVNVKYFHPAALFQPVNHDLQNDLPHYHGNKDVLGDHCPYPVPSKYELFYTTHKNMTYHRMTYGEGTAIGPCETYIRHGLYPPTGSTPASSILCSEPGPVSSVFAVDKEFSTSSTVWMEQNENCLNTNEACFNCTWNCAKPMMLQGGECSVSEKDNGRSPRLPACFSCCCQKNCSEVCEAHHNYRCKTERCQYGNLLEFQLKPIYSGSKRNFYCHMTPVPNQKLMELQYTIRHKYTTLMSQSFTIHGDKSWEEHGKLKSNDHIVNVEIDSKLHTMPDMIEASARGDRAKVGLYKSKGSEAKMTYIAGSSALVRPSQPFKMTASTFGSKRCEDEALEHLILATGPDDPYTLSPDLIGEFKGNYTYVITNMTATPIVKIGIAGHTSVLSSLYPMGTLKKDSLKGNITHNTTHWLLNITGELEQCPGVLSINISDPAYATVPLYQYDVQVKCPHRFSLEFYTPNGDILTSDKEYIIRVRDNKGVLQLHLYKPASRIVQRIDHSFTTGVSMTQSKEAVQPPHFSIPFIASVCGAVMLLVFIAAFGILIKFGQPQADVLRFHWCHLVLVVVYVTVQFLYAVFISMTIFSLIILAVNSDTMAFLKNYQEQRSVKTALSHLELDNMERHLRAELGRQNHIAAESKTKCEQDMRAITEGFEQMRQLMERDAKSKIEKENLRDLLTKHTRELLQKFTYDMNTFKERYISFVRHTEKTFAADIKQTFESVSKNKWFKGASFLHRAVRNLREFVNSPTKPFMEWIGIDQDLSQMSQGLSIPTPKSPRFDAVFQASASSKDSSSADAAHSGKDNKDRFVQVHNIWVSSEKGFRNGTYRSSSGGSRGGEEEKTEGEYHFNSYYFFLAVMVLIDIAWFLHRMLKAVGIARLFLFGYPIFVDIREKTDATAPDGSTKRQSKLFKTGVGKSCSDFLFKTLSSMFVPKVIATVFVCLFVYVISVATFHFVNRETFSYLGYYNNMDDLLRLNEAVVNRRIESHARRINIMEYPTYQELMNLYVKRHLQLHQSIEGQWHTLHDAHSQFYCQYLQSLDPKAECGSTLEAKFRDLSLASCEFEQVHPNFYVRVGRSDSTVAEVQMDAFLTSIRRIISDTCYIVLIYMSTVIIKELLGTVIWLYLKRSGFINLRIIYEADEPPPSRQVRT